MGKNPQISFITICFNGLNDTCDLIESLQKQVHSVTYEIIVVDNASRQNEAIIIQEKYPFVKVVRSETNLGFSGGNNLGIKESCGEYLFIINNDTFIEEDGIAHLVERMESNPQIGGVSPKIRFAFPPRNIQFAGFTQLSPITLRNETIGYGESDNGTFNTPHSTPYLHGAAMIVRREIIEKVGLMPEIFFLYYEELDWCTQITRAGYELWYDPSCTIFHKESQSTGQLSTLKVYYMTRNRLLYAKRNFPLGRRILSVLYLSIIAMTKNSFQFILKSQFSLALAVWRGTVAGLTTRK